MNETIAQIAWPPAYILKKHRRARSVKLRPTSKGLIITVPYRFNLAELPDILESHKKWLIKHLSAKRVSTTLELPQEINLLAINQTWTVQYLPMATNKISLHIRPNHEMVLMGNIAQQSACQKMLITWLKNQARIYLEQVLQTLSLRLQLPYMSFVVRDQKTRWGSCSSQKNISLNYKLLLLPAALMEHIVIHELCHTKYLNHSEKFWRLVATHDPAWQTNRAAMRKADKLLPAWLGSDD